MSFWQRIVADYPPEMLFAHGVKILAIVVGALVGNLLAGRALRRLEQRLQALPAARGVEARRAVTAVGLAGSVVRWAVFLVALIMVLRELGIEATPILAGAGIIGLAVGFGAQTLVRDVISGFLIILEGQLAVGDKAEINGVYGLVDEIGLRTTRIISPGGQVRYFANGAISTITRYPGAGVPYLVTVPVAPERVEEARAAVMSILADFDAEQEVFAGPPRVRDLLALPTYGRVIRFAVDVVPSNRAIFEAKAAARIGTLLGERDLPIPQGREVIVQLDVTGTEHHHGVEER